MMDIRTSTLKTGFAAAFIGSSLVAALTYPGQAQAQAPTPTQEGTPDAAGSGMGRGRYWQSLSPEERQAKMSRFMQMRGKGGLGRQQRPAPEGNYDLKANVAYGQTPLQKMDVYSPKGASAAPIIFFVHGGGWSQGDKTNRDNAAKGASYTANGIVLISVNYGLAPEVTHPKQIEDIAAAFAYVKKHATEFGGDPNRIFIMGHSAGAQLVDLLATNDRFLTASGATLSDIKGVISLDTASLDLNKRSGDDSFEGGMVGDMITTAFGKDPKQLADGSPTLNIKAGKSYPPFLMYCGVKRKTCCAQHDVFAAALKKVGGTANVQKIDLSHRDINTHASQPDAEIFNAVVKMVKG